MRLIEYSIRGLFIMFITFIYSCSYSFISDIGCRDLSDLCRYVNSNIEYISDYDSVYQTKEYFQSPLETEELKNGDCEDFTIYFMYLSKREFNIKPYFVIVFVENMGYHVTAYYDGIYYDPTNLFITDELPDNIHVIITFNYNIIMPYSTRLFTKDITWI